MSEGAGALREPWQTLPEQADAATFGIWLFIASEVLFFAAFFMAFAYLRIIHPQEFALASSRTGLAYGTVNTVLLLTSSLTMSLATRAAALDLRRLCVGFLVATVALGAAFLTVKGFEYRDDLEKHLYPGPGFPIPFAAAQLFFSAYWAITVIHVIHLSLGLVAVGRLAVLVGRAALPLASPQIEVTALYWSLVDIVWVLLYPLIYLGGRS